VSSTTSNRMAASARRYGSCYWRPVGRGRSRPGCVRASEVRVRTATPSLFAACHHIFPHALSLSLALTWQSFCRSLAPFSCAFLPLPNRARACVSSWFAFAWPIFFAVLLLPPPPPSALPAISFYYCYDCCGCFVVVSVVFCPFATPWLSPPSFRRVGSSCVPPRGPSPWPSLGAPTTMAQWIARLFRAATCTCLSFFALL